MLQSIRHRGAVRRSEGGIPGMRGRIHGWRVAWVAMTRTGILTSMEGCREYKEKRYKAALR